MRIHNKLRNRLFCIIVLVFSIFYCSTLTAQNNFNKSPALELFLQQVENEYVPQKWKSQLNWGMDSVAKVVPYFYVQIVGYAMFNQRKHLKESSTDLLEFNVLNEEIISLISAGLVPRSSASKLILNLLCE